MTTSPDYDGPVYVGVEQDEPELVDADVDPLTALDRILDEKLIDSGAVPAAGEREESHAYEPSGGLSRCKRCAGFKWEHPAGSAGVPVGVRHDGRYMTATGWRSTEDDPLDEDDPPVGVHPEPGDRADGWNGSTRTDLCNHPYWLHTEHGFCCIYCALHDPFVAAAVAAVRGRHAMTAPEVQPAGLSLEDAVEGRAAWERYAHRVEAERAELRVVVEGLRTQLAACETQYQAKVAEVWDEMNRTEAAEARAAALGSQVAAVKALLDQREAFVDQVNRDSWGGNSRATVDCAEVRAALESRLG